MNTYQIKQLAKEITGYDYIAVRKGTGSMRGMYNIFSSSNSNESFKPFEEKIKKVFNVRIFSNFTVSIYES